MGSNVDYFGRNCEGLRLNGMCCWYISAIIHSNDDQHIELFDNELI